jgi:hypothetical protein
MPTAHWSPCKTMRFKFFTVLTGFCIEWEDKKHYENFWPKDFLFKVLKFIQPCILFSSILIYFDLLVSDCWRLHSPQRRISYFNEIDWFFCKIWKTRWSSSFSLYISISEFIRITQRGGGVPDYCLGHSGSVSPCNRKGGPHNLNSDLEKGPRTLQQWTTWYSNVLIELFQVDISVSQQSEMFVNNNHINSDFFLKEIFRPGKL